MKAKYMIAAFVAVALTSCKQELVPQDNSNAQEVTAPGEVAQTPVQQTAQMAPQPQQAAVQQQQAATTAPGMNPPHGQPGHRCDIAVGAPLNSAPAKTAPAPAATPGAAVAKEFTPATMTASNTTTAPGMNPPHGQAGHRCDIAVGAPLNSAPSSTPAATTTSVPATLAAPANPEPTETKTE